MPMATLLGTKARLLERVQVWPGTGPVSMGRHCDSEHVQLCRAGAARRSSGRPDDDKGVSGQRLAREDPAGPFLDLYDRALPQVYGYLLSRCGQRTVAEDLTAETFLAAVDAVRGVRGGPAPVPMSTGWLIGVARHKLSDHWRRQAREERTLRAVTAEPGPGP